MGSEDVAFLLSLLLVERQLWAYKRETGFHETPKAERWEGAVHETRGRSDSEDCLWLVERLAELPAGRRYNVREYRSDERAAWRGEVIRRLSRKPQLRRAAVEFLLWWSEGRAADDADLVVLALIKHRKDRGALQKLAHHVSRTVQLRAHAVTALLEGHTGGDSMTPEATRTESLAAVLTAVRGIASPLDVARTWMGDSGIESLLHTTISRVERLFTSEYPAQWANEEERLVTRLLSALEHEFATVRSLLRDAQVRGVAQPVDIHLEYRESTKREEGQRGVGTPTFAVDIAFLVRLETAGAPTIERVTFVQVKKLEGAEGEAMWKPSFHVPRDQMDDLIAQTEASFYLFLVPPFAHEECWLVPARLVRNMMDLAGSQKALPRFVTGSASRSLAQWLTYDILGLWAGDERLELIKKGRGDHPGRRPRFIVSITIRRGHENM